MVVAYIFVLHSSHLAADGSDKIRIADPQVSFQEEFTESVNYIKETTASVRQIEHKQSSRYIAQVKETTTPKVTLAQIAFEGNTVLDDATLEEIAHPYLNRRVDFTDLLKLRDEVTKAYNDIGYISSGAVLPDQQVVNGRMVYSIVEGAIDAVTIEGAGRLHDSYISDRVLKGALIPFNSQVLQRNIQKILNDPLIDELQGQLKIHPQPGYDNLILRVTRARPYDLSTTVNNHGAPGAGVKQLSLSSAFQNLSGWGDTLGFVVGGNKNKYNFSAVYELPINTNNTRLKVHWSSNESEIIDGSFADLDIDSNSGGYDVSISHPYRIKSNTALTFGAGVSVRENRNTLLDMPFSFSPGEVDGRSKVSMVHLSQDFIKQGHQSVLAARAEIKIGINAFGSTVNDGNLADSQFLVAQTQLRFSKKVMNDRAQLLLRFNSQTADRELLPLVRFSLGGASTVRGYRQNEVVRDQAVLATAELRYALPLSPQLGVFQIAPFLDAGYGRNKSVDKNGQSLTSAGVGLLWSLNSRFSGEIYLGAALGDTNNVSFKDRGIHLNLAFRL